MTYYIWVCIGNTCPHITLHNNIHMCAMLILHDCIYACLHDFGYLQYLALLASCPSLYVVLTL